MFTGIVDHVAKIIAISQKENSLQLTIQTQFSDFTSFIKGESICVDGICLTVTHSDEAHFSCDLSPETIALTIAKNYVVGSFVNVERAMRLSDRLGGHIVTGHVDGVIRIKKIEQHNEFVLMQFSLINPDHFLYLAPKGSVCINGVSLTINAVDSNSFSIMLIPHTLQKTNLHQLDQNSVVNVEYDYLAKLVSNNINHYRGIYAAI